MVFNQRITVLNNITVELFRDFTLSNTKSLSILYLNNIVRFTSKSNHSNPLKFKLFSDIYCCNISFEHDR